MIDWNGIRDFLAIIEAGSMTEAAKKLNVSQPTLSRRLCCLEEQLGAKLIIRSPRKLLLTEVGKRIIEQAKSMQKKAIALETAAHGQDEQLEGTVRISTTEGLGIKWLTGHMAEFQKKYPSIYVEISIDNNMVNLLSRNADIAVRLLRPQQQNLITKHVADFPFGFYASKEYVAQHGHPETTQELFNHKAVGLIGRTPTATWVVDKFGEDRIALKTNTMLGIYAAVEAGAGIGPIFNFLGEPNKNLVRVLNKEASMKKEIWLTTLPELHSNARIRVTYDFLSILFRKHRKYLAGLSE